MKKTIELCRNALQDLKTYEYIPELGWVVRFKDADGHELLVPVDIDISIDDHDWDSFRSPQSLIEEDCAEWEELYG